VENSSEALFCNAYKQCKFRFLDSAFEAMIQKHFN